MLWVVAEVAGMSLSRVTPIDNHIDQHKEAEPWEN